MWKMRVGLLLYIFFCMAFGLVRGDVDTAYVGQQQVALAVQPPARVIAPPMAAVPVTTPVARKVVRLIIPAIHVDAPIEPVGLVEGKYLAVPTQNPWEDVGWYRYGPLPGEQGSAVIDGHLDRPGALPAVFWNLHKLQAGDIVMVVDASGKIWRFRVTTTHKYAPDAAPLDQIFGNGSGVHLNLITCSGQWIAAQHQTALRLVVYTEMV
jgi:LPXTG-site transpeptidase (sortase) family protein